MVGEKKNLGGGGAMAPHGPWIALFLSSRMFWNVSSIPSTVDEAPKKRSNNSIKQLKNII